MRKVLGFVFGVALICLAVFLGFCAFNYEPLPVEIVHVHRIERYVDFTGHLLVCSAVAVFLIGAITSLVCIFNKEI